MSDEYTPSREDMIALRKIVEAALDDPLVPQGGNSVRSAQVVLAMAEWLAAHDALVRADEREKCAQIAEALFPPTPTDQTHGITAMNYTGLTIAAAIRGQAEEADR